VDATGVLSGAVLPRRAGAAVVGSPVLAGDALALAGASALFDGDAAPAVAAGAAFARGKTTSEHE
jgi:hypothetical protein